MICSSQSYLVLDKLKTFLGCGTSNPSLGTYLKKLGLKASRYVYVQVYTCSFILVKHIRSIRGRVRCSASPGPSSAEEQVI